MRLILLAAVAALSLCACQPATDAGEAPPAAAPASQDVHAFRVGALEAWALRDGGLSLPVSGDALPWTDPAAAAEALTAAGEPSDRVALSVQPLLIRDGDRLVLIDTGAGGQMDTQNLLLGSLSAAGFEPGEVTDILISHAHGDHIGGLVDAEGGLVFPNASIRVSAPEWTVMQAEAAQHGAAALVAAITPKVEAFEPGAQVTPSITAIPLAGHTPGHTGYEVASGEERLLYIGDAMHSSVLSVAHPEWTNVWDTDRAAGIATRERLLRDGAADSRIIYGVHFPFPGRGRFQPQGDGFVWVPEA